MSEEKQKVSPETDLSQPVMTYGQFLEGRSLLRKFLKEVQIRVKGEKVTTCYFWEFPDEIIAKTFAEQMKDQLNISFNPEESKG